MAWRQYQRLLQNHPFKTKALTSAFITGLSDVGLQIYEQNSTPIQGEHTLEHNLDDRSLAKHSQQLLAALQNVTTSEVMWSRTATIATVGLVYSGPINHMWFALLERLVRTQHQTRSVAIKLLLDQTMFAPVAISGYMTVRGLLESKSVLQISDQLQEKVALATYAAWHFWPVANFVSFSLVPVMYRVLFGNVCAIFWNARLSLISTQTATSDNDQPSSSSPAAFSWGDYHVRIAFSCFLAAVYDQLHQMACVQSGSAHCLQFQAL